MEAEEKEFEREKEPERERVEVIGRSETTKERRAEVQVAINCDYWVGLSGYS